MCHYGAFKMIYFLNLTRETNDLFLEVLISIRSEVLDTECSILKKNVILVCLIYQQAFSILEQGARPFLLPHKLFTVEIEALK